MKRVGIAVGALFLIIFIGLWVSSSMIAEKIKQVIIEKSPVPITIGDSRLTWLPLGLQLDDIIANKDGAEIKVARVNASANLIFAFTGRLPVTVKIDGADINLKHYVAQKVEGDKSDDQQESATSNIPSSQALPLRVPFHLLIENSSISHSAAKVNLQSLDAQGLDIEGPWTLTVSSTVMPASLPTPIPIALNAEISRNDNQFTIEQAKLNISAIESNLKARYDIASAAWDFDIASSAKDLSSVPMPSGEKWQGQVDLSARGESKGAKDFSDLKASWSLAIENLVAPFQVEKNGMTAKGPITANIKVKGSFQDQILNFEPSQIQVNATQSDIVYGDMFHKKSGQEFTLTTELKTQQNQFFIQPAKLQLGPLQVEFSVQGSQSHPMANPIFASVNVLPVNLAAFESMLPIAKQYPMSGRAELILRYKGLLSKAKDGEIDLQKFVLSEFSMPLKMKAADGASWAVDGVVKGNVQVSARTRRTNILAAQANATIDASQMVIDAKDKFKKAKNQTFTLNLQGSSSNGESIQIQRGDLTLPAGTVKLTGKLSLQPAIDIQIQTKGLNFERLEQLIPMMAAYQLRGELGANMGIKGVFETKGGLSTSPLEARGDMDVALSKYVYKSTPAKAEPVKPGGKAAVPVTEKPTPLAPEWPLIKKSTINVKVKINELLYNDLSIKNFASSITMDKGALQGHLNLKVFNGDVELPSFKTSLVTPWPSSDVQTRFKNLNMKDAVNWASADWKDQIQGLASGQVTAQVPFPKRADFLDQLKANGTLQVQNGVFSSLKFQNLVREKVSSIPGVGKSGDVKLNDLRADMDGQFALAQKSMEFQKLHMKTPEKDELHAKGRVGLDKSVDLEGTAYITNPPVQGTIREANLDPQGRFVIPLKIKGYLNKPELGFAQETVQQLLSNAAQYEFKKLQKSVPPESVEELKKKAQEGLKRIFGGGD